MKIVLIILAAIVVLGFVSCYRMVNNIGKKCAEEEERNNFDEDYNDLDLYVSDQDKEKLIN